MSSHQDRDPAKDEASAEAEQDAAPDVKPEGWPEISGTTPQPLAASRIRFWGRTLPWFSQSLQVRPWKAFFDPNLVRNSPRYLVQAALAALAMLAVLLFVDSLSQAALVAGLGSSVVILFVHPSSHSATPRALVGGHTLALVLGSLFAILLFAGPVETFLDDLSPVRNLGLAISVGLLILAMAVTDTEHPPAAGTVLGVGTRPWDLETVGIILGAVALLAAIQWVLRSRLRDL